MSNVVHMKPCLCCDGTGVVEGITGTDRPCSRCRWADFQAWHRVVVQDDRARRRAEAAVAS